MFGMPKAAIELNAASYVLPLGKVSDKLCEIINAYGISKFKKVA